MDKTLLSPGKLYARLSEEFRRLRQQKCSCHMPMVQLRRHAADEESNWTIDENAHVCEPCREAAGRAVEALSAKYDMLDLVAIASMPAVHHHQSASARRH